MKSYKSCVVLTNSFTKVSHKYALNLRHKHDKVLLESTFA